ncbi:hypothetical protein C2W62_34440 [Candidatus Entotheonella serta]|nr:hypothetical protein C2W62_34440 [Candidatus Entotheonella serta]
MLLQDLKPILFNHIQCSKFCLVQWTQTYRTKILDHLGLVAGMCEELGIAETIDEATQQDPGMHIVTASQAVQAIVLNGLSFVNQQLYLGPIFSKTSQSRASLPRPFMPAILTMTPSIGLSTPSTTMASPNSTASSRLPPRLGLATRMAHLDTTSFHVDGRYNQEEEAQDGVIRLTLGYSRDHRPDLNKIMLELIVEHQDGIPPVDEAPLWQ